MFGWLWKRPDARALLERDLPALREAFFRAASDSGKPRGLRWKALEWGDAWKWCARRRPAGWRRWPA